MKLLFLSKSKVSVSLNVNFMNVNDKKETDDDEDDDDSFEGAINSDPELNEPVGLVQQNVFNIVEDVSHIILI